MEARDNNIKRLLKSALSPVPATTFFKRGLLIHLKEELLRTTRGESRQQESPDSFEENLSKLMVASYENYTPVKAAPGFKERLQDEIVTAGSAAQRQRRLNVLSPALAATVIGVMLFMVFLFGIEIYPTYWADEGAKVAVTMDEGSGIAMETRPLFFIWGTRTTKSSVDSGETVSLSEGDKITVGSGSAAVINLFDQGSLKLYPGSVLNINELESPDKQGTPFVKVALETGIATSEINDFSYEIVTPSAVATVLGTVFQTEVISDDQTYLATTEGTVELTMNGDTVQVSEGQAVNAVKGQKMVVIDQGPPKLEITSPGPEVFSPDIIMTGETDVDAEVTVDGVPIKVNLDGTFSVELRLDPGLNDFLVIATNPAGKTFETIQTFILM